MGRIVTFDDLRVEGIDSPPENQGRIEQIILDAEELVESITSRLFYLREGVTIYADGRGTELLKLEHPPIAIDSLEVDGEAVAGADFQIMTQLVGEASLFNPMLRLLDGSVWPKGSRNVKIVGDFGHVLPVPDSVPTQYQAPALIRRAICLIVGHNLTTIAEQVATSGRGEIVREKLGQAEFQYAEGTATGSGWSANAEINKILGRYRRVKMASV